MSEDREWKRGARVARDSRTQLNSELARLSRAHLSLSLTEVRVEVCGGEVVSATARGAGVRTCHSATSSLADHAWAEIEDRSVERTRREEQISFSEWVLSQNVNPGMEVISPTMMRRYAHISVQKLACFGPPDSELFSEEELIIVEAQARGPRQGSTPFLGNHAPCCVREFTPKS